MKGGKTLGVEKLEVATECRASMRPAREGRENVLDADGSRAVRRGFNEARP